MARAILFTILCIAATFPSVSGSATLIPRLSSASCTGHLSDISLSSITCDYSNEGCTFGSEVFITGQVTTDADIPRPMKISVHKTLPGLYSVGTKVFSAEVDDVCESGKLTSYPDGNEEDTCPQAGVYKFNLLYDSFGTRQSWYAAWSGYSFGMAVHIKHEGGGKDYGSCHITVHASQSSDDSYATNATFVSIAAIGLAGVGLFVRRRKERLTRTDQNESDERTKELATNFELVQDSASSIV